jgi:hypothetical protein
MTDPFLSPPVVPRAADSSGPPVPPSGLHPSDRKPAVVTNVGSSGSGLPKVPAATNVHGKPAGQGPVEEFQFIDVMAGSPPGPSRWDTNADGAIHALADALAKAGLPGELSPALKVLERVGQLVDAGRAERNRARAKLEAATRALVAVDGEIDVAEYGDVLREIAPWIDEQSPASIGVGDAARQVRVRAVMTVFGMASGLHQKLRDHCRDVVAVIAGILDPPADVWQAQTVAAASTPDDPARPGAGLGAIRAAE